MKEMKIAVDCRYIGKSGIGTFIENIVVHLLTNNNINEYLLIVNHDTSFLLKNKKIKLLKTKIKPFSLQELLFFPVNEINKCDAFFAPYINIPGGVRIPVYSTIHDMLFFDVAGLASPLGNFVRKLLYKRAIAMSTKIFTVSDFSKERILFHIPTKKEIIIVYNGIPEKMRNHPLVSVIKEDYFIFVGNIKRHKGLRCLLEAYANAKIGGMKTKLYIVGESNKFRTTDSSMDMYLYTKGVEFTGYLPNEKLWDMLARAKALVLPSEYEGFGIPPLEALYLGTNVILSDIPVLKEIYEGFPVNFFCAGNDKDLARVMIGFQEERFDVNEIRNMINRKYNYYHTAVKILNVIKEKG